MASVLLSNHYKSFVKRTKLGLQQINENTAKTINKVLETPYIPLKRSYNLMPQSESHVNKNESKLKSEIHKTSFTTTKNDITKKFGKSRSLLITQNEDYYPERRKRKIFMKKYVLEPKYDYKVVASTNKRKRRMPHKVSVPNSNNSVEWSMADLVRLTEEQGIDDDDFMEILTCPSPVWWEDASDDQEESHIRFHEDAAKKDVFNTQLDYTSDNLYEINKNPLKKEIKKAIITPTLVGKNLKTDQNQTKMFTAKQSKLENILGNIKFKKSNAIPRNNKDNKIDKSRCKVRKDSESYISDTSLNEEDLLKTLESIEIPVQKYDSDSNNEDTEVDINPKILTEGFNQSNNSKRQKRTKLNNKDKFEKNFNKPPKKVAIKTRKATYQFIKINKKLENREINVLKKRYPDIDLVEEEVNDKTTNIIESFNQNNDDFTKRKTIKSNRKPKAKLKQNKAANNLKIKPKRVKKLKNKYIHLKDLDITTDYLPPLTKRPFLNDDKVLVCESPKSIDSISDLNNTNLIEPDSISDSNIKFLDESDEKSDSPSKENQINESKSVNAIATKDSDLVTVYRIISNPNNDIEDQIKINLVNKQVSNSSTSKTKDHNEINEYYKTRKNLHNNREGNKETVKKQNTNGISKNISRHKIKKNIMKLGNKVKYCHNCSSIFDTVTCQYCYKKS